MKVSISNINRFWSFLFDSRKSYSSKTPILICCDGFPINSANEIISVQNGKIYIISKWIPGLLSNKQIFVKVFGRFVTPKLVIGLGNSVRIDIALQEAKRQKILTASSYSRSEFKLNSFLKANLEEKIAFINIVSTIIK